jgi:hypothetical protein
MHKFMLATAAFAVLFGLTGLGNSSHAQVVGHTQLVQFLPSPRCQVGALYWDVFPVKVLPDGECLTRLGDWGVITY